MSIENITCIECPIGCEIAVRVEGGEVVSVTGNGCARGKAYASKEVVCPERVLTTTVRTMEGKILSVKTDKPVAKSEIMRLMRVVSDVHPVGEVRLGDVLVENIVEGVNLVSCDSTEYLL